MAATPQAAPAPLAPNLQLRQHLAQLRLRRRRRHRDIGLLGGRVLPVDHPLAARCPTDHAYPRAAGLVETAAVVDDELLLASERLDHDLLHPIAVELFELLVVQRRVDSRKRAIDLYIRSHVTLVTRETPVQPGPVYSLTAGVAVRRRCQQH